ncbi:hypothetical protein CP556_16595 [Natrinema sp. CBA1119]|uniref:hypothetical protein n=1 Tax=Natrinema sp. CBA1119 TaxID=1608465 RepID=UPI000BF5908F|nr:hypothetical protein [Natrinema sp. CBA1119]PGF17558.1 hypothetical protein CP556_16595 [Natrinema sp. CBA1119]
MTDDASRDEGDGDDANGTEFTHDENRDPTRKADDNGSRTVDADDEVDRPEDEVDRPDDDGDDVNGRSDPLEDLAATVSDDGRERSSPPDFDDLFDRHDAADIDGDRLWERLEADRMEESSGAGESAAGDGSSGKDGSVGEDGSSGTNDTTETADSSGTGESSDSAEPGGALRLAEREIREVEKRSYCQGCEHFTEPPDVDCTRDGTDILAVTTMQTFRVADCPFVLEDEALENRH